MNNDYSTVSTAEDVVTVLEHVGEVHDNDTTARIMAYALEEVMHEGGEYFEQSVISGVDYGPVLEEDMRVAVSDIEDYEFSEAMNVLTTPPARWENIPERAYLRETEEDEYLINGLTVSGRMSHLMTRGHQPLYRDVLDSVSELEGPYPSEGAPEEEIVEKTDSSILSIFPNKSLENDVRKALHWLNKDMRMIYRPSESPNTYRTDVDELQEGIWRAVDPEEGAIEMREKGNKDLWEASVREPFNQNDLEENLPVVK